MARVDKRGGSKPGWTRGGVVSEILQYGGMEL